MQAAEKKNADNALLRDSLMHKIKVKFSVQCERLTATPIDKEDLLHIGKERDQVLDIVRESELRENLKLRGACIGGAALSHGEIRSNGPMTGKSRYGLLLRSLHAAIPAGRMATRNQEGALRAAFPRQ